MMEKLTYTKTALRSEQHRKKELEKYLPTLQLKKALLQIELGKVEEEIEECEKKFSLQEELVRGYSSLFSDRKANDLFLSANVQKVETREESIAGVEFPHYERTLFFDPEYFLFDSPVWLEDAILGVQKLISIREMKKVLLVKKQALEKELREVSIRVNLFEKILIPRKEKNIQKIKIFLQDQFLASVCQAKVAKRKLHR